MDTLTIKDKKIVVDLENIKTITGELEKEDIDLEIHIYDMNENLLYSYQEATDWELIDEGKSNKKPINVKTTEDLAKVNNI